MFAGTGTIVHLGVEATFNPARKAHPAFWVTDREACWRWLEAAGAPVIPEDCTIAVRRFYTADPFDNRIEIIQDGDGFAQQGVESSQRRRVMPQVKKEVPL